MISKTVSMLVLALALALSLSPSAATAQPSGFRILHAFDGTDGDEPTFVLQTADRTIYGVTALGGPIGTWPFNGVVYKIDAAHEFSIVHEFADTPDGSLPGKLMQASDGSIYGVTASGGAFFRGTVYRIDSAGAYSVLHSFIDDEGSGPNFLMEASDGFFYGTTSADGQVSQCAHEGPRGTLFRMDSAGQVTRLHTFCREIDGQGPNSLVESPDGVLFGTCRESGPLGLGSGIGTFWRSDTAGNVSLLHVFGPTTLYGDEPTEPTGILRAADGFFYGVANGGGSDTNGAIFRADASGNITTIHSFNNYGSDGSDPETNFSLGRDGFFYGSASQSGLPINNSARYGVIYRADTAGHVWVLHTFNAKDGFRPVGTPILGGPGKVVYATATFNTATQHGTTVAIAIAKSMPIAQLSFSPNPVVAGESSAATLTLRKPAPVGGRIVQLFATNSLDIPPAVRVLEGESTATFTVTTNPVDINLNATITASIRSLGLSAPLAITASAQP